MEKLFYFGFALLMGMRRHGKITCLCMNMDTIFNTFTGEELTCLL